MFFINSKKENLQTNLSSESYNNFSKICNIDDISYFNKLNISKNAKYNGLEIKKSMVNLVYPIGTFYVQYPSAQHDEFPLEQEPSKLFPGTVWEKKWDNEGIFFRTEGSYSDIDRISDYNSTDVGLQDWKLKRMHGETGYFQLDRNNTSWPSNSLFTKDKTRGIYGDDGHETEKKGGYSSFDIGNQYPNNVSLSEVRAKNRIMKIWKRVR